MHENLEGGGGGLVHWGLLPGVLRRRSRRGFQGIGIRGNRSVELESAGEILLGLDQQRN